MKNDSPLLKDHHQNSVKTGKNGEKINGDTDWETFLQQLPAEEFYGNGTFGVLVSPAAKNGRAQKIKIFKKMPRGYWQCTYEQVTKTPETVLEFLGNVEFTGEVYEAGNVSALGIIGDLLLIGSDEGNKIQVLKRNGSRYRLIQDILLNDDGKEVDVEGIACDGDTVYIVGSHSWKRPKMRPDRTYEKNRNMIEEVIYEKSRDKLFRLKIDKEGRVIGNIKKTSLRKIIDENNVLKVFSRVPGKENGVDIEGIAVHNSVLYFGFRGPVLRGNYVPVLVCPFPKRIRESQLLYVNLGGRGIRDFVRVNQGFFILAGPVGDGPGSYQLYFWDGRDCIPGKRMTGDPAGQCIYLCEIPTPENAKAEGITVLQERKSTYEFLITYDSLHKGGTRRFRITKPPAITKATNSAVNGADSPAAMPKP